MKLLFKLFFLIVIVNFVFIGCASRSIITNPEANIKSSLEEITKYDNDKAKIIRKLLKKIGNMELYNVADYSKRIVVGPDLGYGIFYDLKNNRSIGCADKGSASFAV